MTPAEARYRYRHVYFNRRPFTFLKSVMKAYERLKDPPKEAIQLMPWSVNKRRRSDRVWKPVLR